MFVKPPQAKVRLPFLRPIRVIDENMQATWTLPSMDSSYALPTLWKTLEMALSDWLALAEANPITTSDSIEDYFEKSHKIFNDLMPRYVMYLFSYTHNFFLLENGYRVLFEEIRHMPLEYGRRIRTPKKPKRPSYVERLRLVRNRTMTHWGGPEDKAHIDSRSGRLWGFSFPSKSADLKKLGFGHVGVDGATPRHLLPLDETHEICEKYLLEYDYACADMYEEILGQMPTTINGRQYFSV